MAQGVTKLTIDWGQGDLPAEKRYEWLAAWVVDNAGQEGEFFHEGPGGGVSSFDVPDGVVGFKLRCASNGEGDGSQPGSNGYTVTAAQFFGGAESEVVFEAMSLPV